MNCSLLGIAVALGCDAFSVAVGVGSRGFDGRRAFRLAFHFALFQFLMPLIGLVIGSAAAGVAGKAGVWVASAGLAVIGARMAWEAVNHPHPHPPDDRADPTRGWSLVILSVSTSVDALVAGFSLGLLHVHIILACGVIGLVAGLLTLTGLALGATAARSWGHWAEFAGGVLLVGLGVIFVVGG
jgi:manganese efflux pump family protein